MGKRTVEKADSEKGLFADAQSLKQSSLRCGTRFVGAAGGAWSGCMRRLAALCIAAVLVFSLSGLGGCAGEQFFNMSRILSIDKIGPDLDSFEARPGPFSISIIQRRPWRVFPTLVFAV